LACRPNLANYPVVKSQEEALSNGKVFDYCLLTTKCLPDILPNSKLLGPALASDQIKSFALIQNGLDIEKDVFAVLKEKGREEDVPIVTAAAWIGLMTSPDGKRITWAGPRVRFAKCSLEGR
jgi:2-dehydropantoate 2-reductase